MNEFAFQFHRRSNLLIVRCQDAIDDTKLLSLFDTRELCVYALDFACNQLYHFGCAGQAGEIGKRDVLLLRELGDVLLVNHYKAAQEWLAVADHDSVGDIGAEFDLILDFGRGEAAAAYRPDSESAERFLP